MEILLSLLIGLAGSIAALISVAWTIYWNVSGTRPVLKFHVTTGDSLDQDPILQNVPHRIWVTVVNVGRSKLLLDSIGLSGAATDPDPFGYAVKSEKYRLSEPSIFRALGRAPTIGNVGAERAIELLPTDSYRSRLPLHTFDLLKVPGDYWNLQITSRTGKTWKIPAAHVAMGERRLPRFILDADWIPKIVRWKHWYCSEMKSSFIRIRKQAESELNRERRIKASSDT